MLRTALFSLSLLLLVPQADAQAPRAAAPERPIIILVGPPQAGKGTVAEPLIRELGVPNISPGALIRELSAKGDPQARHLENDFVKLGKLAPFEEIWKLVRARISQPDCRNGFILDGFPRDLAQAVEAERLFAAAGMRFTDVVLLKAGDSFLERRMAGRRVCNVGGESYHLETKPPRRAGFCDNHPAVALTIRPDDNVETFRRRLTVYHEQTEPMVEHFRRKGLVREVEAETNSADLTFDQTRLALWRHLRPALERKVQPQLQALERR